MAAGKYNTPIQVQRKVTTGGSLGHGSTTWEDVFDHKPRAHIRYGSGSEAIRSGQESSLASVSVRIHYQYASSIDSGMRVLLDGVAMDIQAVLPDAQRRKHVDLVCKVST